MDRAKSSMSLYTRVSLAFLALLILLALSVGTSLWLIQESSSATSSLVTQNIPVVQSSLELLDGIHQSVASMRGWLVMPRDIFKKEWDAAWQKKITPSLKQLEKLSLLSGDPQQIKNYQEIGESIEQLKTSQIEIMDMSIQDKKRAIALFSTRASELVVPLNNKLELVINIENQQMEDVLTFVSRHIHLLNLFEWTILIFGMGAGLFLSRRLAHDISSPIISLAATAEAIATGDLKQVIQVDKGGHELQQLASAIKNMIDTMQAITLSAKKISEGDYLSSLAPRSEQDDLLIALNNMTKKLAASKQYYEEQAWLQQGAKQTLLCVAQNSALKELCTEILIEICRYLNAGIGVLYLFEPESEQLNLISSFAYTERNYLANHFKLGNGIVGQVGLELKPILLKNVHPKDLVITTGLTEEAPLNTYTFPLIDKNSLVGVIELAFHETITPLKITYIENSAPLIASNIRICEQKEQTERLLDQQKMLTEELKIQQEELKTSNEELERQTEELKTSEEELRVNEEEQRTLNQALEERNKLLQEQTEALKVAQGELETKANQIEQASKYKSQFLANMSHELRTPLNSLLILSKFLAENKENNLNAEQIESLEVIHRSGLDLLKLINDVLDLAKVEAGKLKLEITDIVLKEFVDTLKADFLSIAKEKHLEFITEIKPQTIKTICSDTLRLKQVLKNLLSNAFKFTEQGQVSLEVHFPPQDHLFQSKHLHANNCIGFSVIDTGIGIPQEKHELVFQTFFQGDGELNRKYNGTGLGLSISAQLTQLLQGELHLVSEEQKGSRFTLYIPIKMDTSLTDERIEKNLTTINTNQKGTEELALPFAWNKKLLIIEDDLQFAKILTDACTKKGYECQHAANGKTGLAIANQELPVCIFLDINLPDMSGLTLADQLKSNPRTKHIPLHFISGANKSEEALQHGATSYLMKPITLEKLDLAIESIAQSINEKISRLLIIEDDEVLRLQIQKSYAEKAIEVDGAGTGQEALNLLRSKAFDCMILDLNLPDLSGFELLKIMSEHDDYSHPAVIVYTGREFTEEDHALLQNYSKNIIIKGKASMERLLDESALFLHRIEKTATLNQQEADPSIDPQKQLANKKILLVDDDMRNTFALAKLMHGIGVHTTIAPHGKAAIAMLIKDPDFDAILMDIMMPVMDGFEAITTIREMPQFKNIPIIALTAKAMANDKEKCLQVGATDYLSKPLNIEKLFILLRAYLCQ